ncbi:YraN family protein [Candidatus Dojkabacteria bacterium]|nr:YraN family protein [Candidatus Dojkabacteria bacterium]
MTKAKIDLGKKGEDFVEAYLNKKGFETVERNYLTKGGELDIVSLLGSCYVFVEVKTREFDQDFDIFETISYQKRKSLVRTCNKWLMENNKEECEWRIDFVGVILKKGRIVKIEHLEGGIF